MAMTEAAVRSGESRRSMMGASCAAPRLVPRGGEGSGSQPPSADDASLLETSARCSTERWLRVMEQFAVAHSGSLNHVHTLSVSSSVVDIARETRLIVTVVVVGWVAVTVTRGLFGSFGNRRE